MSLWLPNTCVEAGPTEVVDVAGGGGVGCMNTNEYLAHPATEMGGWNSTV